MGSVVSVSLGQRVVAHVRIRIRRKNDAGKAPVVEEGVYSVGLTEPPKWQLQVSGKELKETDFPVMSIGLTPLGFHRLAPPEVPALLFRAYPSC